MNSLFDEFRTICSHLNQVGITPTLMESLGFEYRSNEEWLKRKVFNQVLS